MRLSKGAGKVMAFGESLGGRQTPQLLLLACEYSFFLAMVGQTIPCGLNGYIACVG